MPGFLVNLFKTFTVRSLIMCAFVKSISIFAVYQIYETCLSSPKVPYHLGEKGIRAL